MIHAAFFTSYFAPRPAGKQTMLIGGRMKPDQCYAGRVRKCTHFRCAPRQSVTRNPTTPHKARNYTADVRVKPPTLFNKYGTVGLVLCTHSVLYGRTREVTHKLLALPVGIITRTSRPVKNPQLARSCSHVGLSQPSVRKAYTIAESIS